MVSIRKTVMDDIKARLNRGFLTPGAFHIVFNNQNGEVIRLTLKEKPEFYFVMEQPNSENNSQGFWKTSFSPGVYFMEAEATNHNYFPQSVEQIAPWLDRVMQELMVAAGTDSETLEQMRRNLEETAENLPDPEQPFSDEELAQWSARFDAVAQRLESVENELKIQHSKIEEFKNRLNSLKEQGATLPRSTWVKAAGYQVLELLRFASHDAVKSLASGAIKLLLGHDT